MNLAVHGLEGKIAEAITYYQDEVYFKRAESWHRTGKRDWKEPETFRRSRALRKQKSRPSRGVGLTSAARRNRYRRLRSGVWLR